jgi:hypothetical protein
LPPLAPPSHQAAAAAAANAASLPAAVAANNTPATASCPIPIQRSSSQQQQGPGLLQQQLQLQQLTSSLQEAVRLQDSTQLHILLRLLASFPVTAELLLLSQAGAAVWQLLLRQQKQMQQQGQASSVAEKVAAAARQLLSRWKAVLAAEVASADSSRKHKALQVGVVRHRTGLSGTIAAQSFFENVLHGMFGIVCGPIRMSVALIASTVPQVMHT